MFENKSKVVFASALLGVIYSIYLISNFFGGVASSTSTSEAVGGAIATAIIMPHLFATIIASVFNVIAFLKNKGWANVVALAFYIIALVLFPIYFMFVLPMIILSIVGMGKIKKINKQIVTS